mmetsp:Transcript_11694/g.41765  ORF Transcript_11694/g.41765 Transcript_11694/m.41765 type:complete len:275 (+) Transcript_11694:1637-2461(+)
MPTRPPRGIRTAAVRGMQRAVRKLPVSPRTRRKCRRTIPALLQIGPTRPTGRAMRAYLWTIRQPWTPSKVRATSLTSWRRRSRSNLRSQRRNAPSKRSKTLQMSSCHGIRSSASPSASPDGPIASATESVQCYCPCCSATWVIRSGMPMRHTCGTDGLGAAHDIWAQVGGIRRMILTATTCDFRVIALATCLVGGRTTMKPWPGRTSVEPLLQPWKVVALRCSMRACRMVRPLFGAWIPQTLWCPSQSTLSSGTCTLSCGTQHTMSCPMVLPYQ